MITKSVPIVAFWQMGATCTELRELLRKFERDFDRSAESAGFDGFDVNWLGGIHVWLNNPTADLRAAFSRRRWEAWS